MIRILQIDGGGIKGIMPALVLQHLEEKVGKPLCDCFELIAGTSTGALIGGAIAAGVPAQQIADLYIKEGRRLFTPRGWWNPKRFLVGKYDREPFQKEMEKILGKGIKLSDLKTNFMATSFNLCSQRTHFIKSWCPRKREYELIKVLSWSALSAAHYFGKIEENEYKWYHYESGSDCSDLSKESQKGAVFQDGGQGIHNNTLGYLMVEILANGWIKKGEKIYLLSLGTGAADQRIRYEEASKFMTIRQVSSFLSQARKESILGQVIGANYISKRNSEIITFKRIDREIRKKEDDLDKVEYIEKFMEYGQELANNCVSDEDVKILLKGRPSPEQMALLCFEEAD